jgi:hypothetical protein
MSELHQKIYTDKIHEFIIEEHTGLQHGNVVDHIKLLCYN